MSVYHPEVSRVSIRQNTHYQNTDNLYRPLRETIAHPEILRQHEDLTSVAAQSSMVSKQYKRLNTLELRDLQENTFIPDAELYPTGNLDLIRGQKFVAVDACERYAGPAISQQEMDRIQRAGMKQSTVVYEIRDREVEDTYRAPAYDDYGKKPDFKYNMFSCIDQPVNECKAFGCGHCTGCPSNQVIARENHPPSIIRP